jgi:hypothetical protein
MLINEYLRKIYINHIPKKTFKFIDNITVYTENRIVYKVLLRYTHRARKQLLKLKIYSPYKFITNPPNDEITDDIVINAKPERLTIIYDKNNEKTNVCVGESIKMLAK